MSAETSSALLVLSTADLHALRSALERGRLVGLNSVAELQALGLGERASAVAAAFSGFDATQARTVLSFVLAERERRNSPRLELVWTGPEPDSAESRKTAIVVRRLLAEAQRSVLIAGYRFDHGAEILEPLHRAMVERGVQASVFLDLDGRAASDAEIDHFAAARIERFLTDNWPFGPPHPVVYYEPRTASPTIHASLHAKCVVVDEARTLVTSANFTSRGQSRNVEVGVLIDDETFARRLAWHWMRLVAEGLVRSG